MQRSELLLVESSCNFDLSTIQHELCAIVHDVAKIVEDEAAVNTPYIIDLSEYSVSSIVIRSKPMCIANKLRSRRVSAVFILCVLMQSTSLFLRGDIHSQHSTSADEL
jgi:hypothetical protein